MTKKPTYEELKQKVTALEQEAVERRRFEEELQTSAERYRTLIENMPIVCFTYDRKGNILSWNQGAENVYGYTQQEAVGASAYELIVTSMTAEATDQVIKRVFNGEFVAGNEWQDQDKQGNVGWRIGNAFPLFKADGSVECGVNMNIDITDRKQIEEQLKHSQQELRNLANYLQSVREQERKAVSREIHDELGQALTGLKMDLAWLEKHVTEDPAFVLRKIKVMDELLGESIKITKQLISRLRPGALDDLGLIAAMEWELSEFETSTGIACNFALNVADREFSQELSIAAFRIFQETLSNVRRHAQATRVWIQLEQQSEKLVLIVKDDGIGIKTDRIAHSESFGLMGIRERIHQCNGQYSIYGVDDEGTTVVVELPLS